MNYHKIAVGAEIQNSASPFSNMVTHS